VQYPAEYATPEKPHDLLSWAEIDRQIAGARNYWLASSGPSGAPHVRPVDGVWVDGALCFGGSPETRWVRNVTANSHVSVNLPSDELAVILEGEAELVIDPAHPLATPSAEASRAKYPQYYEPGEPLEFRPFWLLRPRLIYAWTLTGFPNRATRWSFES
jgi:hypothetical protein